jgi:hypothetical protein
MARGEGEDAGDDVSLGCMLSPCSRRLGKDLHDERVEGDALHVGPAASHVQRAGDAEAELTAELGERKWSWRVIAGGGEFAPRSPHRACRQTRIHGPARACWQCSRRPHRSRGSARSSSRSSPWRIAAARRSRGTDFGRLPRSGGAIGSFMEPQLAIDSQLPVQWVQPVTRAHAGHDEPPGVRARAGSRGRGLARVGRRACSEGSHRSAAFGHPAACARAQHPIRSPPGRSRGGHFTERGES